MHLQKSGPVIVVISVYVRTQSYFADLCNFVTRPKAASLPDVMSLLMYSTYYVNLSQGPNRPEQNLSIAVSSFGLLVLGPPTWPRAGLLY